MNTATLSMKESVWVEIIDSHCFGLVIEDQTRCEGMAAEPSVGPCLLVLSGAI